MFKSVFKSGIRAAYDVLSNPTFVSEPWSIYPAKHYSTGKLASVFIFDKAKFESTIHKLCANMSNTKNPKVIISECYELIKYEIGELVKLKHPQILTTYEVLEETKLKFLFATEAITGNLQTISLDSLDELSIQKGLLELCKGIQFLHNYCSIIHLNLQPSSVFINEQGDWKLAGFKFLQNLNEISPQERENYFVMNNTSIVPFSNHNLNFTAPELVIDSQLKLDFGNDIWSLGCLIYYIYNRGDYLINCFEATSISDFKAEFRKFETKFYNHRISDLKYVLKEIPEKLYPIYPSILARRPTDRATIDQIIDADFFNGSLIKAMWFIDEFSTKSLSDKILFLKGLLEVRDDGKVLLDQFPANFKNVKFLPLLIELLKSEVSIAKSDDKVDLVCHVLAIILNIGGGLSQLSFHDRIFEPIFKIDTKAKKKNRVDYFDKLINYSVKVRLVLIQNLDIFVSKLNDRDLTSIIKQSHELILTFPSDEEHFKAEQIKLQDLFLSKVGAFIGKFDFPYIKNTFFPLICQVFKTTTVLSTKLETVKVFEAVVQNNVIDKIIVTEQLLPIFQNLKSRDKRIVESVLKFFDILTKSDHINLELDTTVESVLPICLKLVFGCNDCTQAEFKSYMKIITTVLNHLTTVKLAELPVKIPPKESANGSSNFDSFISSQPINTNTLESKSTAPLKPAMVPSKPISSNSALPVRERPVKPPTNSTASPILQPKRNPRPLKLKPEPRQMPNLTFGATSNNTASTGDIFGKMQGTNFSKNDEFLDFQSAVPNKPLPADPSVSVNKSMPPGFSNSVLTPSRNATPTYPSQPSKTTSDDLLDLI